MSARMRAGSTSTKNLLTACPADFAAHKKSFAADLFCMRIALRNLYCSEKQDHDGGLRSIVAIAQQAIPSRRPTKPIPSEVVAFKLIRDGAIRNPPARAAIIATR